MPAEIVPASSVSDGRWRVTFVPLGSNALSVAILNGATAKPLTYGFTGDGFNWSIVQAMIEDKRLTLTQDLSRPGRKKETLDVKYVDSVTVDSAALILVEGVEGQLVVRRAVSNATTHVIAQVADVITFQAGAQRPDAPVENGLDTISQTLAITALTVRKGALVA